MNSELLEPSNFVAQCVFVAVVLAITYVSTSGWFRLLQQRREIAFLSGKLSVAHEARLNKLAELLNLTNVMDAYRQGVLWCLLSTVESHLVALRRLVPR
ncbi:hypothetical protein KBI23_09270 [bacterium]|nr:hypothetical protein [bacterium]MBP9810559.1 hypothetical protein [bacterium]